MDHEVTMDVLVVPPLSRDTDWIEVIAAGRSAEVRATLPVRWQWFDTERSGVAPRCRPVRRREAAT
jgi:hypothetical protein